MKPLRGDSRAYHDLVELSPYPLIAVVGAGPSLDYCRHEIERNLQKGALFFLTDIVARRFVQLYPEARRVIFTVEHRRHGYLKGLMNEHIALYTGANFLNLPQEENRYYCFHFDFDQIRGEKELLHSTKLVSPGTVAGAAVAGALYLAKALEARIGLELFGLDFAYPEERVYARMAYPLVGHHGFGQNRETLEYEAIMARRSRIWVRGGYAVSTSEEFHQARLNLERLIGSIQGSSLDGMEVSDFSPLGVSSGVMKKIPLSMK